MGSTSLSSPSLFCKMFSNSPPFVYASKTARSCVPRMQIYSSNLMHSHRAYFKGGINGSISARKAQTMVVACGDKGSSLTPLETVLKLCEAIKAKNISELSDVIAEECFCVSNFFSAFQPFLGKKQVLTFFSALMKNLGNNIEFVVQQTSDDGMAIGVSWKLEWNKVPLPLGNGFSFYMCHVYQGKVMIKNVEIFLEPILHIEPLRLKVIYLVTAAMEKLNIQALSKNKSRKVIIILVIFLLTAAVVILLKQRVST